ncbi:DUF3592 domain-containing protein [Chloroflexus sp.]|uniref:DUF3592 domain-containing protein n=1 Tax=Chloroflexus sp. TaxID=1904827 RepID=UPI002ADE8FB6|nr:DUF3592 domain-containing protein [Chloroflexus sp.]
MHRLYEGKVTAILQRRMTALISLLGLLIVGLGLLILGWQSFTNTSQRMKNTVATQGTVVEIKTRLVNTNSGQRTFFYPIVEFRTATGETIQFESEAGDNPSAYQIDDRVEVMYNPGQPQTAFINSWELWLPSTLFLGTGVLLLIVSGIAILDMLKTLFR